MNKIGPVIENVDPQDVFTVMSAAASQDPAKIQDASARLLVLLEKFGTYDVLQEIAATRDVALPIRQQSMIQFKNSVVGRWKSRKYLSDEHRVRMRARCLQSFLTEEDDIIAECNEVVVAKIARSDYPRDWSGLITELCAAMATHMQARYASPNTDPISLLVLRRSLKIVNEILKEFAVGKLPQHQKAMALIARDLYIQLSSHYAVVSATYPAALMDTSIGSPRTAEDLLVGHLLFKCLVKIASWVWNRPKMPETEPLQPWIHEFFQSSAMQFQSLSETRLNLVRVAGPRVDVVGRRSLDQLTRHVRLFGKCFRRFQQLGSTRFIALPLCNDLVLYYWSKVLQAAEMTDLIADSPEAVFPVRFLVQAMSLFKGSLAEWTPVRRNGTPNEHVLSQQFVEDAVRLLVTKFIPLKPADLEGWVADPEEWVNVEDRENDYWEYELRPCAERLLITLANQYKQFVTPLLKITFNHIISTPTVTLEGLLQKEAIYCAIGRCANRLKDDIPFGEWLEQSLLPDTRQTDANYPIMKRRIAWVVGKFVSDQCVPANNPKIWEVLVHLLGDRGPGTDAVVRLTAALAIKECVDTIDFDADVFQPFLSTTVTELLRLIAEAENLESKRRTAGSLNTVIERSEKRIVPLIPAITAPLPALWNDAESDWLFKTSLLVTATNLIAAAREQSTTLGAIVVPLIQECFSTPETKLHLEEDGIALWQAALANTMSVQSVNGAPALLQLFPVLIPYLAGDINLLGRITSLIESYLVVDAPTVLQVYAGELFSAFVQGLSGNATTLNKRDMITSLALLMQIAPSQMWAEAIHTSGLFACIFIGFSEDKVATNISTEIAYLLSRMALNDVGILTRLISATAAASNIPEKQLYEGFLDQFWNRFDNMSEPRYRKLAAMGIAALVATGRPEVLERLPGEIFNLWLDVFGEIKEARNYASEDGEPTGLTLYWDQDAMPYTLAGGAPDGSVEYDRRKTLFEQDIVRTTQLTPFVRERLQQAEAAAGGGQIFQAQYLSKADPVVLKQIQDEFMGARP